jgi:hypothetical protein
VLLSVHCDSSEWVKRAKDILRKTGATDVGSAGEKAGDFANTDRPRPRVRGAAGGRAIPEDEIYEERAQRTGDKDFEESEL